jgi:cyclopropane fatty-acyl-phospholipid synthase-like methyltransferase
MDENYYEDETNVNQYIQFTPAHDGALLVEALTAYLDKGSSVLEIGMGPGKDYKAMSQDFKVTGSDRSKRFLELYREKDAAADLLHLDARSLDTERTFDAVFSNKALIHLTPDELQQSFERQHEVLNDNGLIMHSFWNGEGEYVMKELTLVYHNEKDLTRMLEDSFDIVALEQHAKMADGDSIYVIARKK